LDSLPPAARSVVEKHIAQKSITASGRGEGADDALNYLIEMGVDSEIAKSLSYNRLRSQGVKQDTAKERVQRLPLAFGK
jgi:hypothetical protein